jgi:nucleoside-triphosphatase THEP1
MITIITGKINGGKSTTILKHYIDHQKGDGFISNKRMNYNRVHSYQLVHLAKKLPMTFVITTENHQNNQKIACQIGPYLFLEEPLNYVKKVITECINQQVSPIYLDEIGPLELDNKCFHEVFQMLLDHHVDCIITVRQSLLDQVISKYQLTEFNIINVS